MLCSIKSCLKFCVIPKNRFESKNSNQFFGRVDHLSEIDEANQWDIIICFQEVVLAISRGQSNQLYILPAKTTAFTVSAQFFV